MILSKVSLHGFKSFAKRINLNFDGKLTAIVGPNGCGKTNIVDAIRWGLGEQKHSILRTDRMEDVIFSGAQSAKPLGMAEVSITFDNSQGIMPIDYNEVVITRRLYRSGESEYLLNKSPVRLKDIHNLLMDTGIGAECYSVIELKMIEDILSEKAEDRRKLLEEAAGVTKYKYRIKSAGRKLESTNNDLLRVNDIIQEVERNVRSLKRQVQRARRYKKLQKEKKEFELKLSRKILSDYQDQIKPLKIKLEKLKKSKDGRTVEISKEEADLETLRLKLTENEKYVIQCRNELNAIIEKIHHQESDIKVGKEKVSSLNSRIERANNELINLKERLTNQKEHLEYTRQERESYQVKITSTGRIFNNKKKELEVFQQNLNLKRLDLNAKKKEIIECLEKINSLSNEESAFRTKIDNNQGRLERLDEEDTRLRTTLENAQTSEKNETNSLNELLKKENSLNTSLQKITEKEKNLNNKISDLKENTYKTRSDCELFNGRLEFLKNVIENREGMTNGAKILLKKKPAGLIGTLADLIDTKTKFRKSIETGLGETAGYLVFDKTSNAFHSIDMLNHLGGGRVVIVSLDKFTNSPSFSHNIHLPDKTEIFGWAEELIEYTKNMTPLIKYLLSDLLIVGNIEDAKKVIETNPKSHFRVATIKGELVTSWGTIHTSDDQDKDTGLIGRKQRLQELEKEYKKLTVSIKNNTMKITELEKNKKAVETEKNKTEVSLSELRDTISTVKEHLAKITFEKQKTEENLNQNIKDKQTLLEEISSTEKKIDTIHPQMEKLAETRETVENDTDKIQKEVDQLEKQEQTMEDEVHRLNLSVVRLKGEARNLDLEIERSERLIQDIELNIKERNQEIKDSNATITEIKKSINENEETVVEHYTEKEETEKKLTEAEEKYQKIKEDLDIHETEVRKVRKTREQTSEQIHNLEMETSELEHQALTLKQKIRENYQTDLEKISLPQEIDLETSQEHIDIIKQKLSNLGNVNLMALEEYDRETERLNFLNQQRDDLLSAKETLNETIKKINHTARKRFKEIFVEVRKNFRKTFTNFFDGGEADLRIPEGEDPLEAQIEIVARPAGKHFRDLSLLSGGERALTAISLLFALYLIKPSPFCILDEIDAPLDDLNINRFINALKDFAKKVQFIIVTHNKMTMQAAKALYGVTMEEKGVSKIVSVKFEDDGKKKKKAEELAE